MKKGFTSSASNRLAIGLSSGSWPLLQKLKDFDLVDQIALTSCAASEIDVPDFLEVVESPIEIIRLFWSSNNCLIFIGAIGAVVRLIAPFLEGKDRDPAVIAMDSFAQHIVPIVGLHNAGGEEIALELAMKLDSEAIFTSESKTQNRLSLDNFGTSWGWTKSGNISEWSDLVKLNANNKSIKFFQASGSKLWQKSNAGFEFIQQNSGGAFQTSSLLNVGFKAERGCNWHPHTLWVGVGCERNTSKSLIERAIFETFSSNGLAMGAIAGICSISLKSDEKGLIAFAQENNYQVKFFPVDKLNSVVAPNPSEIVKREIGANSVAEASAILAAGMSGKLLVEKKIFVAGENETGGVTVAIANSKTPYAPKLGELHLIGAGPGNINYLTFASRQALSNCPVWIGYEMYLDLLEPFRRKDQVRINSQIKKEKERCQEAINLAMQGIKVSLISSGDSGIYGMAGLALELLLEFDESNRPLFEVHPGISALQMAAAKAGSPLMSDFCAVSLSDLLTPWQKIIDRIKHASKADFIIAIYNPKSKDRDWQLEEVISTLLQDRSKSTPVVLSRQLGRPGEKVQIFSLGEVPIKDVDMLSILIVGNSQSYVKDGFFVTPRGYLTT